MYASTHEMPQYPGTGSIGERGEHDQIVNAPFPKDVLCAISVMDVEIDDRDALSAVGRLGMSCGDGRIVEEAKTHRRRDFGMMAGRSRGDEGVSDLLGHHLVDSEYRAAGRAQGRLERAGRHRGVVVDGRAPLRRRPRADRIRYSRADGRARSLNFRPAARRLAPASGRPRSPRPARSHANGQAARDVPRPCHAPDTRGG